jgi:hypothetical protein
MNSTEQAKIAKMRYATLYPRAQKLGGLLGFALTFVVIAAPLADGVCEAVCATYAAHHPESQPSHHHHHAEAPAAQATQSAGLTLLPHHCGHLDGVVAELTRPHIIKAVGMTSRITPLLVRGSPTFENDSRRGPPVPTRSTSPLRI